LNFKSPSIWRYGLWDKFVKIIKKEEVDFKEKRKKNTFQSNARTAKTPKNIADILPVKMKTTQNSAKSFKAAQRLKNTKKKKKIIIIEKSAVVTEKYGNNLMAHRVRVTGQCLHSRRHAPLQRFPDNNPFLSLKTDFTFLNSARRLVSILILLSLN